MKQINPYDFVKFNFIKDVLLFGNREFTMYGVFTWLAIICFFGMLIITSVLIYQYNTL